MKVRKERCWIPVLLLQLTLLFPFAPVQAREPAAAVRGGQEFVEYRCDRCHDLNAAGDGPLHTMFLPPPANLTAVRDSPAMLSSIIRKGIRGTAMPPNRVSAEEIAEILAYLKTRPFDTTHQWDYPWELKGSPPPPLMGSRLYVTTCAGCHGVSGNGRTAYADTDPHFWPKPANFQARNSVVGRTYYTITYGRQGTMMAPQAPKLTEQARWALSQYVAALFDPGSTATIQTGPREMYKNPYSSRNRAAVSRGKTTYDLYCIGCHGAQGNGTFLAPKLTDRYWLYGGGTDNAVFMVETKGIPGKLMPSFRELPEKERWETITYLRYRGGLPDPVALSGARFTAR